MSRGAVAGVRRGCGTRVAGGIYAELGLAPPGEGVPIQDFLLDPPTPMDHMEIAKVGVTLFERDGATHILDWVGEQYYPNVTDFVEEVARFGLSRRLPSTLNFDALTPASRILTIHARAWIVPHSAYRPRFETKDYPGYYCPKALPEHEEGKSPMCIGTWWEDVTDGEQVNVEEMTADTLISTGFGPPITAGDMSLDLLHRLVNRRMPSFTYQAFGRALDGGEMPDYRPALFAAWPIGRLGIVRDTAGGKHEDAMRRTAGSRLPRDVVEG